MDLLAADDDLDDDDEPASKSTQLDASTTVVLESAGDNSNSNSAVNSGDVAVAVAAAPSTQSTVAIPETKQEQPQEDVQMSESTASAWAEEEESTAADPEQLDPAAVALELNKQRIIELKRACEDKDAVAVFPEALVGYLLNQAGCELDDDRIKKLVSLEAQYLIQEILEDMKKVGVLKTTAKTRKKIKVDKSKQENGTQEEQSYTLNPDELEAVLKEKDVVVSRAPFHLQKGL